MHCFTKIDNDLITVILPAYNEGAYLKSCVEKMIAELSSLPVAHELLICEGGSTDATRDIAERLALQHRSVKVVHVPGVGYGKALRLGILSATGKYTIIYNVDLWSAAFAKSSLDALGEYDLVVGSKTMPGASDKRPLIRRVITIGFNLVLRILLGYQGTDTHGMKAGKTVLLQSLADICGSTGDMFDTELILRASRRGFRILEVPVVVLEPRPSRWGLRKRIVSTFKGLIFLMRILEE